MIYSVENFIILLELKQYTDFKKMPSKNMDKKMGTQVRWFTVLSYGILNACFSYWKKREKLKYCPKVYFLGPQSNKPKPLVRVASVASKFGKK